MSDFDTHELGEWLTAYLDGELDGAQRDVVERVLRESDEARRMLADLSDAAGSVAALPQHPAPDALLDDLRLQLERRDLLGDESDPRGSVPARSGWSVFSRWGLAAALGFAAVGGTWTIVDQMQDEPSTAITLATKESGKSASSDPEDNVGADAVPQQSRELTNSADIDVRLVSVLNFEQKLAAGLPQSALMDHQFDNERMRLSLQADSATDQSALNRKILDQLGELGMSDLGTVESAKLTEAPAGRVRVYLSGREGKNFEADATRQVLIRLPADEVPALYEQIERIAPRDDQIALQLEARSFDGKSRVSPTIQNLFGQVRARVSRVRRASRLITESSRKSWTSCEITRTASPLKAHLHRMRRRSFRPRSSRPRRNRQRWRTPADRNPMILNPAAGRRWIQRRDRGVVPCQVCSRVCSSPRSRPILLSTQTTANRRLAARPSNRLEPSASRRTAARPTARRMVTI